MGLPVPGRRQSAGKVEEGEKDQIQFVEAGKDATKAFEPAEQPLDFVAPAVHGFVILPGLQAVMSGWNHRDETEVQRQLQGFVVLVSAVHDQMQGCRQGSDAAQQFAAFDGVRRPAPARGQRLWPFAHLRQPYESWWSIRRATC